jgi:hypothetical protein
MHAETMNIVRGIALELPEKGLAAQAEWGPLQIESDC